MRTVSGLDRAGDGEASAELRLYLLGGFRLSVAGRAVEAASWRLRKAQTIVKVLALAPMPPSHSISSPCGPIRGRPRRTSAGHATSSTP